MAKILQLQEKAPIRKKKKKKAGFGLWMLVVFIEIIRTPGYEQDTDRICYTGIEKHFMIFC